MIRKATVDDIPLLASLTRISRLTTYGSLLPPEQQTAFRQANKARLIEAMLRKKITHTDYLTYIYEQAGEIYGYIVANPHTGTIPFLFVHQDHHGKGVGGALFAYLAAKTTTSTYRVVVLESNTRACDFYESKGFSVIGIKDQPYFGVRRLIMEWVRPGGRLRLKAHAGMSMLTKIQNYV